MRRRRAKSIAIALLFFANASLAELALEQTGTVERLAEPFSPHWVWVSDLILERAALVDLDSGRFLGQVNGGYGAIAPLFAKRRAEIYLAATYFSRRSHGERTDVIEIHSAPTLSLVTEIVIPARRAIDAVPLAHSALSGDERFVAVFNWTPSTSLSIVDVERRTYAGEIEISGCSLVYPAGERGFFSLCADGAVLYVMLDDAGKEAKRIRSRPFFDPLKDPVTEKAVRWGRQWLFASFAGRLYSVEAGPERIRFAEPWALIDAADRKDSWRIGGWQHLAVHEPSARLYSLVHRGGEDTHKDPGEEVWVYDLRSRRRIERIELVHPGLTIHGFPLEIGKRWIWPFSALFPWAIDTFAPALVSHIQVTADAEPLLFTAAQYSGSLGVYDALSGKLVKRVQPVGWTTDLLLAPYGEAAR